MKLTLNKSKNDLVSHLYMRVVRKKETERRPCEKINTRLSILCVCHSRLSSFNT